MSKHEDAFFSLRVSTFIIIRKPKKTTSSSFLFIFSQNKLPTCLSFRRRKDRHKNARRKDQIHKWDGRAHHKNSTHIWRGCQTLRVEIVNFLRWIFFHILCRVMMNYNRKRIDVFLNFFLPSCTLPDIWLWFFFFASSVSSKLVKYLLIVTKKSFVLLISRYDIIIWVWNPYSFFIGKLLS